MTPSCLTRSYSATLTRTAPRPRRSAVPGRPRWARRCCPARSSRRSSDEVGPIELVEVLLINTTAPFLLTGHLKSLLLRSWGGCRAGHTDPREACVPGGEVEEWQPFPGM